MPVGPSTRFILAIVLQSASKVKYVLLAHRQRMQDGELPILKRVKNKPKKAKQKKAPQTSKKLRITKLTLNEDLARSHREKQARLKSKPSPYEAKRRRKIEKELSKPRWVRNRRDEYREGSVWATYTPMGGDPRYKIGRGYI